MFRRPEFTAVGNDQAIEGTSPPEFSQEERTWLLRLAHDAIESALDGRELPRRAPTAHLEEPRGAFTTLYHRGELRGCVGHVLPTGSLYETVIATARAAAFEDTRFWPVKNEELPDIRVSLSVLSLLRPIAPEEIVIGMHGLLVSKGGHRGLLLPQVPVERGWDRVAFLQQTCRKAGLGSDDWSSGALVEAFTAEVFSDVGEASRKKKGEAG